MKLPLPPGKFQAYLFDCDGTIVDSMPLHYTAWKAALAGWNCDFPEDRFYAWGGYPVSKIITLLNEEQGLDMPVDVVTELKDKAYFQGIATLQAIPEVVEHIEAEHGKIPFAVVSGSRRSSVKAALGAVNLLSKFETLVCAEDCKNPKPYPDSFLLAAERLGVEPSACLVFEDADSGIAAAKAAGMQSVRVAQPWERN